MSKTLEGLEILKRRGLVIGLRIYGKVGMRQQQRLLGEVKQLKIADQIRLMGYVERTVLEQDLQQALGSLIVKCDTPFNRYNFPTKLMDALKWRVPVIASTGNLFKTYFKDRGSACLVNPNSATEIADAIQYLAEHPTEARAMADQAHNLLEDEFNAEAVCRRFLKKFDLSRMALR
jgi:glycosyltransferase involved in cell wall biosynthesis